MMGMGMGLPPAKSKDFRGSSRRLFGRLRPERPRIAAVVALAIVSVFFAVLGPKILGNATNIIFEGVTSRQVPAGVTQAQVVAGLRAQGQDQLASMVASMHLVPGSGVDFSALGTITRQRVSILDVQRRADAQTKSIAFLERDLQRIERLLASGGLSSDRRTQLGHEAAADKLALKTVRQGHKELLRRAQLAKVELVLATSDGSAAAGRFKRTLDDAGSACGSPAGMRRLPAA